MAEEYKRSTNELIERLSTCETLAPSRDSAVLQKCLASLAVRSSPSYTPSALDSRLLAAMDAAQRGSERLSGHLPLQPNALKKWDFRSEPLTGIFRRVSIQEAAANERASGKTSEIGRLFAQLDTIGTTSPRKAPNAEDVFTELRQSFMHFGMAIDQNDVVRKRVIMQDKEQQKAHIMLRVCTFPLFNRYMLMAEISCSKCANYLVVTQWSFFCIITTTGSMCYRDV